MGGGSSELRMLIARLDELEVALETVERALVLRGRRLAAVEKLVNEHDKSMVKLAERMTALDASVEALTDQVGPVDFDLSKLEDRVAALEKILRSSVRPAVRPAHDGAHDGAQDDKPASRSKKGAKSSGGD